MREEKKIVERQILDLFRRNLPDFPVGKIVPSEAPDFLVRMSPRKTVGIELVSLPGTGYDLGAPGNIPTFITDFHHIIGKKDNKLKSYRKNLAVEYWLVVCTDTLITGRSDIRDLLSESTATHSFDRLFLFELFDERIVEL